jgi:single-strand DNA-binding protein
MNGLARVVLVGNLTRDPELRTTAGGTAVGSLSVAVNERVKVQGEWTDRVSYFDCTVWGNSAESCAKYLGKGSPVAIDGRLRQDRWEHEGQKRQAVKVVAESVQFLPDGEKRGSGGSSDSSGSTDASSNPDDDIPF